MVNLFGKGFVGTHYSSIYDCIVNDRNDLTIKSNEILYMISTTDNYNVKINPYVDIETNLVTLIRVLENCKGKDVTFNFVSSWFVYGDSDSPYTETSYCNPRGFYSITKRTAEQLLITYCEAHNIKYRIFRLANVVGPGDKNVSVKKNVLTYLIREIIKGNDITLVNEGNFYRDFIHVKDVCRAINLIMQSGELNSIYNIGTGKVTRFRDAIEYVWVKTNSTSKVNNNQNIVQNQAQIDVMAMDITKLKLLGYEANYDLIKILDELIVENS